MPDISAKFEEAMADAVKRREKGEKPRHSLSLCIEGPNESGKSYIARKHLDALARRGLIDGAKTAHLRYPELDRPQAICEIDAAFVRAKGGAIIVDDICPLRTGDGETVHRYLEDQIVKAISEGDCTVILIGDTQGMNRFKTNGPIMSRMCDYITITPEAETALAHPTKALSPLRFVKPPNTLK
jgi:hypothetical protein